MKFTLTDYQRQAVQDVLDELGTAEGRYKANQSRLTAVGLTAPTGAGKTVIAAAVIEQLFFGGENTPGRQHRTIVWITDDPSLNEQSKEKIGDAASLVGPHMIETVDAQFDQRAFDPGKLYFLNIQKLGDGATGYIRTGDTRRYSLWETIGNTVADRGEDFLVVIDEAHRGTGEAKKPTILRRILDGGRIDVKDSNGSGHPVFNRPAPMVLGISATPKKFYESMSTAKASRVLVPVETDMDLVRASGLIKDRINVNYSTDDQPTDDSLLRTAVEDLIRYDALWKRRRLESEGREDVKPLLVVQVPDKAGPAKVSQIVQTLVDSWEGFRHPDSIAHAFGEKAAIPVSVRLSGLEQERRVQYIAPQNIAHEHGVRAVIFMKALTTGWDCPRAEVMVSLRTANEYTEIAQLIGRMVRNPLAARIEDADYDDLNAVDLYLPKYNRDEVAAVVKSFMDDETVDTRVVVNPITLHRNPTVPAAVWEAVQKLPRELKPSRRFRTSTQRLIALAVRLDNTDGVANPSGEDFSDEAEARVVATLEAEYTRLRAIVDPAAAGLLEVSFERRSYDQYSGEEIGVDARAVAASNNNIRDLRDAAVRSLPDASGKWYLAHLYAQGMDPQEAAVRLAALARQEDAHTALESASAQLIAAWQNQLAGQVSRLPRDAQLALDEVWHPHGAPIVDTLNLPETVKGKTQVLSADKKSLVDLPLFQHHLFADVAGFYPESFTSWEKAVVEAELAQGSLVAWYRNPSSSAAGLSVAYQVNGTDKSLYPDLLFFHAVDGEIVVDLVDPHNHSLSDTAPKWSALARFAEEHSGSFRRVAAVIKDKDGRLRALPLTGRSSTELQEALIQASTKDAIEAVFERFGGNY